MTSKPMIDEASWQHCQSWDGAYALEDYQALTSFFCMKAREIGQRIILPGSRTDWQFFETPQSNLVGFAHAYGIISVDFVQERYAISQMHILKCEQDDSEIVFLSEGHPYDDAARPGCVFDKSTCDLLNFDDVDKRSPIGGRPARSAPLIQWSG